MKKGIAGSLVAAIVASAALVVASPAATSASTSYGYVYLVTPRWWGWCPGKSNAVKRVDYVVDNVSSGGDSGDDIVYAKVRLNQNNTVTMAVQCTKTLPQGSQETIKPTRNKQTFWMGYPSGAYGN